MNGPTIAVESQVIRERSVHLVHYIFKQDGKVPRESRSDSRDMMSVLS